MPRTTLNLDAGVLRELRRRQRAERRPLGDIASELLTRALRSGAAVSRPDPFEWKVKPMGLRVSLEDKDEVERLLATER